MKNFDLNTLAWEKMQGLLPVVVQDAKTSAVLMLAYMNQEALQQTLSSGRVTFYSRSKARLWVKGESSGNYLKFVDAIPDCDQDSLLILAEPQGPTCHKGDVTCFGNAAHTSLGFLNQLEQLIATRAQQLPEESYTSKLFKSGVSRIAQKVGEEGVEVALAAVDRPPQELCEEVADLLFHVLVLLRAKDLSLFDVVQVLQRRHLGA